MTSTQPGRGVAGGNEVVVGKNNRVAAKGGGPGKENRGGMVIAQRNEAALVALDPQHLSVLDESHMHSRGLQTHFKAVLVSQLFEGLNRVKRHQKVYATLGDLMSEFHALALHTYTPEEWAKIDAAPASPTCAGGH